MHEAYSNLHYPMFKLEKYVRDYPWLYFNVIDAGYKCKICEMFPPLSSTCGNASLKFAKESCKMFDGSSTTLFRWSSKFI